MLRPVHFGYLIKKSRFQMKDRNDEYEYWKRMLDSNDPWDRLEAEKELFYLAEDEWWESLSEDERMVLNMKQHCFTPSKKRRSRRKILVYFLNQRTPPKNPTAIPVM